MILTRFSLSLALQTHKSNTHTATEKLQGKNAELKEREKQRTFANVQKKSA